MTGKLTFLIVVVFASSAVTVRADLPLPTRVAPTCPASAAERKQVERISGRMTAGRQRGKGNIRGIAVLPVERKQGQ